MKLSEIPTVIPHEDMKYLCQLFNIQSMELLDESIKDNWKRIDEMNYRNFDGIFIHGA